MYINNNLMPNFIFLNFYIIYIKKVYHTILDLLGYNFCTSSNFSDCLGRKKNSISLFARTIKISHGPIDLPTTNCKVCELHPCQLTPFISDTAFFIEEALSVVIECTLLFNFQYSIIALTALQIFAAVCG